MISNTTNENPFPFPGLNFPPDKEYHNAQVDTTIPPSHPPLSIHQDEIHEQQVLHQYHFYQDNLHPHQLE